MSAIDTVATVISSITAKMTPEEAIEFLDEVRSYAFLITLSIQEEHDL
jgi:hypothetical protein